VSLGNNAFQQVFSYHHVAVVDTTEFFFGVGTKRKSGLGFKGKIPIEEVDSIRMGSAGPDSTSYLVCWVKNGTSIVFSEEDYLWIKPNSELGFWCTGTLRRDGEQSLFKGVVPRGQIVELKTEKFDVLKTALLTSPVLLLFVIPKDWKPFKWVTIKL
jgi:hypothetical protein